MYILVGDNRFSIAINDDPYCMYDFRLPVDEIRTIEVTRDLQSISQIDHRSVFPQPMPIVQADSSRFDFSNDAPRKFYSGHVIRRDDLIYILKI